MKIGLGILLFALSLCVNSQATAGGTKDFASWRAFFTEVAKEVDILEQTPDRIFDLATDSDVENYPDDLLVLVRPNLYSLIQGPMLYNQLRGTSNNGPFYLLKRTGKGLHLIGRMEGNQCKSTGMISRGKESSHRMFECTWHNSAASYNVARYETDGDTLKHVESFTIEDGKRKP